MNYDLDPSTSIKITFKNCLIPNRRNIFKNSNCILPISVGQKLHEGNKLAATLCLINNSFKECTILIDDSIQWHTLKIIENEPEEKLREKAIKTGDYWIKRNKEVFNLIQIPKKILRWEDWRTHKNYRKWFCLVSEAYNNITEYNLAFKKTIESFLSRFYKHNENYVINNHYAYQSCIDYLKEECAVMCLWAEENYDFEVYPTGRNNAMKSTYDHIIKKYHPNSLISVSLYFKNKTLRAANINKTI